LCWRSRNAIALVLETPGDLPGGKGGARAGPAR
jgi:hypothetical protein